MDSSPKNENAVIIYSSSSSSKPVWISLFCQTQRKIFWRKFVTRLFWGTIDFHSRKTNTMQVNGAPELLCFPHSSEYLPLCSAEQRHSYRFGTTWGWVNDDRIFIFGWTIPLNVFNLLFFLKVYFKGRVSDFREADQRLTSDTMRDCVCVNKVYKYILWRAGRTAYRSPRTEGYDWMNILWSYAFYRQYKYM